MNWYSTGYGGVAKEEQRIQSSQGPSRFWMPAGASKDIVLVDDDPFCVNEHNAKINNNWRNHHTCNKGLEETCFSCTHLGEKSKAFTGYLTMVDCSLWEDKKGNKYQYELKLIGAKLGLLKKWERKKKEKTSLVLSRWKVHREDDKKASTGDEWESMGVVEKPDKLFELANYRGKKLPEWWALAESKADIMAYVKHTFQVEVGEDGKLVREIPIFNYMELLAPRGNAWAKDLMSGTTREEAMPEFGAAPAGASDTNGGIGAEDDVPF